MSNVTRRDKIKLLSMLKSAVKYCCEKFEVSTWPIAISIDLPHYCIRTGRLRQGPNEQHHLARDNIVEITSKVRYRESCTNERIYIDDQNVLRNVKEGIEVTLSNGSISLICTKVIDFQTVLCKVIKEGELGNLEYVCFRGVLREVPVELSKADLELIEFAKEFNLDIITIKVVHSPITLRKVRDLYAGTEAPLLISTICDQVGLENVDAILNESDGIILAGEFLAFYITDMNKMYAIQLQIGAKCRRIGKPFFISGNILQRTLLYITLYHSIIMPVNAAEACVLGCAMAARQMRALVIILPTVSGKTAVQLTHVATDKIILTISSSQTVARKLQLYYGIIPVIYDTDSQISVVDIQRMLEAGMNIARFKLSSSTRGEKMRLLSKIEKAAVFCCEKYDVNNWPIASCLTLKTCIAKTGLLENNEDFIILETNTEVILFYDILLLNKCNKNKIFVDYPLMAYDIKVGTEICIAEDEINLTCISIVDESSIKCVVTKGGKLTSMSVVCARNTKRSAPLVTKKDFEMVQLALDHQAGKSLHISGGVFTIALKTGCFSNHEISDVTNAIIDGVSGFILEESYNPDNIIEVLHGINELCYTIEPLVTSKICYKRIIDEFKMPINAAEATAISCVTIANQTNARVIIIPTVSGKTLRCLNWMRPSSLIITVSTNVQVTRRLIAYRSIMPLLYTGYQHSNWQLNVEARIFFALEYAVKRSWLVYGDTYITLQRCSDSSAFCDMVRIWKVSISKKALVE
ncbi:jg16099 [Pararge aegeria aegeria]|uniref:Pyruvate kinase n=1 Tax=Pararge aegeria aegeria TaxID=348720 RepID=A0A8S4S0U8_9NEOP|nr:jg16099 [Pararge aegeria aegeria]